MTENEKKIYKKVILILNDRKNWAKCNTVIAEMIVESLALPSVMVSHKVDWSTKRYFPDFQVDSFICPSCGEYSLEEEDNYCRECGAMLKWYD